MSLVTQIRSPLPSSLCRAVSEFQVSKKVQDVIAVEPIGWRKGQCLQRFSVVVAYSSLGVLQKTPSCTFVKVYVDPDGDVFIVTCAAGICRHYLQAKIRSESAADLSALKDSCKHLSALYATGILTQDYVNTLREAFDTGLKLKKDSDAARAYFDRSTENYEFPSWTKELMAKNKCAGESRSVMNGYSL
jgi:hypothetical protein